MIHIRTDIGNARCDLGTSSASRPHGGVRRVVLSEVLAGLTAALDVTEGQPVGHSVRACIIGMRIGRALGLPEESLLDLMYGLLLKDLGCSSNAARVCQLFGADDQPAKRDLKLVRWTTPLGAALYAARQVLPGGSPWARFMKWVSLGRVGGDASRQLVELRCERGADLAGMLGMSTEVREAIRALDEHWDGGGHPRGLQAEAIPVLARIMGLAQTAEVFHADAGSEAAMQVAIDRSGSWFDPELVGVLRGLHREGSLWRELDAGNLLDRLLAYEPAAHVLPASDDNLDRVARVFSWVIDAKSPWTLLHSENVARIARGMARELDLPREERRRIYRAGLLHDVGKLAVSNLILDKPRRLDDAEWAVLRAHPAHTRRILAPVACFGELADAAGAHHERLDGEGYDLGLRGDRLSRAARVLGVADRFEAMSAFRPYRGEMPIEDVMRVLADDRHTGICPEAFEALEAYLGQDDALVAGSLAAARRAGHDRLEWLEASRSRKPEAGPALV